MTSKDHVIEGLYDVMGRSNSGGKGLKIKPWIADLYRGQGYATHGNKIMRSHIIYFDE